MRRLTPPGLLFVWWAAQLAGGCAPVEPPVVRTHVRVLDDVGEAVVGAAVEVDGRRAGHTEPDGGLWLSWPGDRGGRVEVEVLCPDGYQSPPPRSLRARHTSARRIVLRCVAAQHQLHLAIAAPGGEGLPVRVDGEHVAYLSRGGVLHASVARPTGSDVRIRIDTTSKPELRPQNPVVKVHLDRDEVVAMTPSFERERPRRRGKARPSAPKRPRRLRSL